MLIEDWDSEIRSQFFSARHPEPRCLPGKRPESPQADPLGNISKRIVKDLTPTGTMLQR
jgi:hypothetical protein